MIKTMPAMTSLRVPRHDDDDDDDNDDDDNGDDDRPGGVHG